MSTITIERRSPSPPLAARIARKVWREVSRPILRLSSGVASPYGQSTTPHPANGSASDASTSVTGFYPQQATVEPEGIPFLQRLVRESRKYPGPIIEVGTLLGVTTTHMALAKAPEQKIVTVDIYCWNPWGLTPDVHESLTSQVLYYLVQTGQVDRLRMDKDEFYQTYVGPTPAMVFLDAMHDYENTKKDIEWAQRIGAKIISGHDYSHHHPGVVRIVDELGGPRELGGSVWVL